VKWREKGKKEVFADQRIGVRFLGWGGWMGERETPGSPFIEVLGKKEKKEIIDQSMLVPS